MIFRGKRGKRGEKKELKRARGRGKRLAAALMALTVAFTMSFTASTAFAGTSVSAFTSTEYTHNSKFDDRIIVNGIDVSAYQENIDWQAAKAAGVDFAIIRVGYRGYGTAGNMKEDSCFVKHIEGAKAAGVMVGVYFFSQALNTLEARAEAKYTLELLGDCELDLPIFMDYEFSPASSGRFTSGTITKYQATENVKAFCEYIEENGHEAGLYANLNFLNKTVDGAALGEKYPIWIAQYYTTCNYDYTYDYWQYSSSGAIAGISARTDVNFMYLKHESEKSSELSMTDAVVYLNTYGSYTYSPGVKYEPSVSVYHNGIPLTEGVDYELSYIKNAAAGTAYAMLKGKGAYTDYKLTSFNINPSSSLSGITIKKPADRKYTGSVTKPSYITVTDVQGNKLIENLDYTYRVENAVNVGEASLYVDFIGNYTGTKSVKYNIVKASQTITLGDARTSTKLSEGAYNLGVSLKQSGALLTYSSSNTAVATVSTSGLVTPKSAGTTTLSVKAAATSTAASAEKMITLTVVDDTVQIPAEPSEPTDTDKDDETKTDAEKNAEIKAGVEGTKVVLLEADEIDPGRVKLTWLKSNSGYKLDGYEIWRSTEEDSGYTHLFTTSNKYYINTKGLEANTTYYYQVRGVRTVDGETVYTTFTLIEVTTPSDGSDDTSDADAEAEKEAAALAAKNARIKAGVENTKVVSLKAAEVGSKRVKLTWKKSNSGYSVDTYQIYRSTKKSSGYSKIFTSSNATNKYYVNTKGLEPNTTYWYKVRGVRTVGGETVYTPFTKIQVKTAK